MVWVGEIHLWRSWSDPGTRKPLISKDYSFLGVSENRGGPSNKDPAI